MSKTRFVAGTVVGAVVVATLTGTAYAATGGTFILGRANGASTTTSLSNSGGTALSLGGGLGKPALAVNNTVKVPRLNADLLDGLDSSQLQRRVSGTCLPGFSIRAVSATGSVTCDDQQASIVEDEAAIDDASTDSPGFGAAVCPDGYIAVGGGYVVGTSETSPVGIADVATPLTFEAADGSITELYVVSLRNVDGTAYTAGGTVTARCAYGNVSSTSAPALRRGASLRREGSGTSSNIDAELRARLEQWAAAR